MRQIAGSAEIIHINFRQLNVQRRGHGGCFGEIKLRILVAQPSAETRGIHGVGGRSGQFFILRGLTKQLVLVALAHFASIRIEDQRQMPIRWPTKSKRVLQDNVLGGVIKMLLRAQHGGHAHQFIVHHNGKVIGWKSIGFANDKVVNLARGQSGVAQNFIMNSDSTRRRFKANHRWFALFQPCLNLLG